MCVNTQNLPWERPATTADCAVIASHFPGLDYAEILHAMQADGAQPLASDLTLLGAMWHTPADDFGMRYVPFCAPVKNTSKVAKLPVMEQIVEWFENTALGTDMWQAASDWLEQHHGMRVHFAMNCGCGMVKTSGYADGTWTAWKQRFNATRSHLYGRTQVVTQTTNSLENLDMTAGQLMIWQRARNCLESLAASEQLATQAA